MKNLKQIRFINDSYEDYKELLKSNNEAAKEAERIRLLSSSLKITKELTPKLYERIIKISNILDLEIKIEAYVYNDSEMNASCFSYDDNSVVIIMISSRLVNNMKLDELDFVIGHELGHYLFGHLEYGKLFDSGSNTLDNSMQELYQSSEISADRIGLLSCKSIEVALKAMIKTVSGLNDEYLTDSIHSYMRQIRNIKKSNITLNSGTHPIFPVRSKALLLFSMSEYYYEHKELKNPPFTNSELEKKIMKELNATTLKVAKEENDKTIKSYKEWIYIKHFLEDKRFEKQEQDIFKSEFGEKKLINIKKYITTFGAKGINKKFEFYKKEFYCLPNVKKELLIKEIKTNLGNINFDI